MTGIPTVDAGRRSILSGRRFMRHVSIGTKLWSTTAILTLPLVGLGIFYVHTLKATLWFTSAESTGYTMIRPLDEVARRITAREVMVVHSLTSKQNAATDLKRLDDEIDSRLGTLISLEAGAGNAATHGQTETLHSHWLALRAAQPGTPQDAIAAHEHLMDDVAALTNQIGSDWNLTLDPELATYNLIDVTLTKLPDARHFIAQTRAQLATVFTGGRYQPQAVARSLSLLSLVDDRIGAARDEVKTAAGGAADDAALAARINGKSKDWDAGIAAWSADLVGELSKGAPDEARVRTLLQASDAWEDRLDAMQDGMLAVSAGALEARHAEQARSAVIALAGSFITMAAGIVLMLALARRISGAIMRLLAISESISRGNYDSVIDQVGNDEISRLFAGIETMQKTLADQRQTLARQQESLAAQMSAERAQAVENGRIRSALDNVAGCVMVADAGAAVIYTNPAITTLLCDAEADIRRLLPDFSAARIRGMDLRTLHEAARRQSGGAPDLSVPHSVPLECGGRTFHLTVNPVLSPQGERLGTVVEWVDRTVELAMERETQAMLESVLAGDLAQRIDVAGKTGFFETLGRGMNRLTDNIEDIITKVQRAAREVHGAASEISAGNSNLSSRTEQQSASLEETASSMEQITAAVKQNSDNAQQASQMSAAAREQAQAGGAVVNQAIAAMAEINESSGRIANIIGVIDEIAFQTNLLALNAAVEAARAGTQGRGFAVVASEVRSLASRSAAAAKEIKELIRDSVDKVEGGTRLVTQSGQTLGEIVLAVKKVTDVVAEIASASGEQSGGIEQVNLAITQMDEMTQQNAALVEQATAASQAMAQQAGDLTALLAGYRTGGMSDADTAPAKERPRRWAKAG